MLRATLLRSAAQGGSRRRRTMAAAAATTAAAAGVNGSTQIPALVPPPLRAVDSSPKAPKTRPGKGPKPMSPDDIQRALESVVDNLTEAPKPGQQQTALVNHGVDVTSLEDAPLFSFPLHDAPFYSRRKGDRQYFDALSGAISSVLSSDVAANEAFLRLSPVDRVGALVTPLGSTDVLRDICNRLQSLAADSTSPSEASRWHAETQRLQQQIDELLDTSLDDRGAAAKLAQSTPAQPPHPRGRR